MSSEQISNIDSENSESSKLRVEEKTNPKFLISNPLTLLLRLNITQALSSRILLECKAPLTINLTVGSNEMVSITSGVLDETLYTVQYIILIASMHQIFHTLLFSKFLLIPTDEQ